MAKKIIWTPEAELSFESVIHFLQEHWSEKEIVKFVQRAEIVIKHIERHPLSYRSAGKEDIREALVTKQNLLLYRIEENRIYLLYFWDTRKNSAKKPL